MKGPDMYASVIDDEAQLRRFVSRVLLEDEWEVHGGASVDEAEKWVPLAKIEKRYVMRVLQQTRGNKQAAARVLGWIERQLKGSCVVNNRILYSERRVNSGIQSERHRTRPGSPYHPS
jgi:hypothetical protein